MTQHFNRTTEKEKRRLLRQNQTPAETIIWRFLRNRQTAGIKFRRQYSIDWYIIDFYAPKLKLAIEIDGSIHDLPEQKPHDTERQNYLENFGITFLRIRNEEIFDNPDKVFEKIEDQIKLLQN
ncbi:MAG: endonuclease domain-containing protein [Bacteroidetes bacterium]|nr:endonuclease domain-containing protein [Bacteroidota bacterium]MBU2585919.1 endonuclease domain-containing protein [Bacteroidota bacterium]